MRTNQVKIHIYVYMLYICMCVHVCVCVEFVLETIEEFGEIEAVFGKQFKKEIRRTIIGRNRDGRAQENGYKRKMK